MPRTREPLIKTPKNAAIAFPRCFFRLSLKNREKTSDFGRFLADLCAFPGWLTPFGRNYPAFVNNVFRFIHKFASANSVITCAAFFARPL